MSRRAAIFAAVAIIGLSAVYAGVPSTPANAAGSRAVANVKMKEASKLRNAPTAKFEQRLGKYNRMFEMY